MKTISGCDMYVLTNHPLCTTSEILIAGFSGSIPHCKQLIQNCVLEITGRFTCPVLFKDCGMDGPQPRHTQTYENDINKI
jgi:hypothetical protein